MVGLEATAEAAVHGAHDRMDVYLIAAPDADVDTTVLPVIRDVAGEFGRMYDVSRTGVFVVRPDGYLGYAATDRDADALVRASATDVRVNG